MNNPKVTVTIPVYNKSVYLSECLEIVLNQTLREIEVICVDDASTDGSRDILTAHAKNDRRLRIITHNHNRGVIQARKSAIIQAEGDYIAFVDADDLAEPDMCEF